MYTSEAGIPDGACCSGHSAGDYCVPGRRLVKDATPPLCVSGGDCAMPEPSAEAKPSPTPTPAPASSTLGPDVHSYVGGGPLLTIDPTGGQPNLLPPGPTSTAPGKVKREDAVTPVSLHTLLIFY